MKKCSKCKKEKSLDEFANQKSKRDGKYPFCRKCERERELSYRRSKKGLTANMYSNQISNSKSRGMKKPNYSLEEFRDWCFSQDTFHELYDDWVSSGYDRRACPSGDRIDNSKSYTLDNLQLVSFNVNEYNFKRDIIEGKYEYKNFVSVVMVDEQMNVIKRWKSAAIAVRDMGHKVSYHLYQKKNNRMFYKENEL